MIVLQNIVSTIAHFKPINVNISMDSIVKIEGDNGTGKTSLIKILCGLSNNYTGLIKINGYDLKYNIEEFKSNIQAIFSQNGLYEDLNVEQNISLWSKRWSGIDLTEAGIKIFGLEKYRHTKINKLSSGFKRKVALAKLITCPCKIWIIDEADSYLDSESLATLKDLILQRISNSGIVFFTAHSNYLDDIKNNIISL